MDYGTQYTEMAESWEQNGMEQGYRAFAKQNIKNYYYFRDFFVKWRFSAGKGIVPGVLPVAGLEAMENKDCLLATTRTDVAYDMVYYKDFTAIAVGRFINGISTSLRIYPEIAYAGCTRDTGSLLFPIIVRSPLIISMERMRHTRAHSLISRVPMKKLYRLTAFFVIL